jgi:hypothetical protein
MAYLKLDKALAELQGARKDGAAFLLGEDLDVTLYASLGEEVLQISRVSRIDLGAEMLTVWTHKGERFFLPPERLVALRAGSAKKPTVGSSAGFRA